MIFTGMVKRFTSHRNSSLNNTANAIYQNSSPRWGEVKISATTVTVSRQQLALNQTSDSIATINHFSNAQVNAPGQVLQTKQLYSFFTQLPFPVQAKKGDDHADTPIYLKPNPKWINKETRAVWKYAPVIVSGESSESARKSMHAVLQKRLETCRELARTGSPSRFNSSWFSFTSKDRLAEESYLELYKKRGNTEVVLVISGGNAKKIATDLNKNFSLAWHPENMRNEPVYLLVHDCDYQSYASELSDILKKYPNLHLVGWNGGLMTGFGAARAAALAYADTLPYSPEHLILMDQDVVQTEGTRHTSPTVQNAIKDIHKQTGKSVAAYGVGYPAREAVPQAFSKIPQPEMIEFNSPTQQLLSIQPPFRERFGDGIYPAYMVAGGEDMLVGFTQGLYKNNRNITLLPEKILKKELKGETDFPNIYWNKARVDTLKALFEKEKDIMVEFEGERMNLDTLMSRFVDKGWIDSHPSPESYNVSACIVERVILRLHKEKEFPIPTQQDSAIFNRSVTSL